MYYAGKIYNRTVLQVKAAKTKGYYVLLCTSCKERKSSYEVWYWNGRRNEAEWSHSFGSDLTSLQDAIDDYELR